MHGHARRLTKSHTHTHLQTKKIGRVGKGWGTAGSLRAALVPAEQIRVCWRSARCNYTAEEEGFQLPCSPVPTGGLKTKSNPK